MHQSLRRVTSLPSRARSSSSAGSTPLQHSDTSDSEGGYAEELTETLKPPKPIRSPLRSPIGELRKHFNRPSLKREATSPVYLDPQSVCVSSIPSTARRVAQCVSSRLRSTDSDVASISSNDSPRHSLDAPSPPTEKKRRGGIQRNKWTKEETDALVSGCNKYGIGQWKAIRDADSSLMKRSPGDLKDRFRTYFPDAYRKHYPNAKTHMSDRQRSKDPRTGKELFTDNAARKERKQFSAAEDEALKRGYAKHGTAWSSIARDPILASRKSTDLRDRFRNAFPDLYAAAGYKSRPRKVTADLYSLTEDQLGLSTGTGMFDPNGMPTYPVYSSRTLEHVARNQLPSLDFLKTHGADAFVQFRGAFHTSDSSDLSSAEDQVPELRMLNHTITPRPNMLTPRPNDTTPRPYPGHVSVPHHLVDLGSLHGVLGSGSELMGHFKPMHKTQSSMDLTQFSHLNIGHVSDASGSFSHESSLSPPTHYADLSNAAHFAAPYGRSSGAFNYSSPELSASGSIDPYFTQSFSHLSGALDPLFDHSAVVAAATASGSVGHSSHGALSLEAGPGDPTTSSLAAAEWPHVDLDAASKTFSAFTYDMNLNGIMNMQEAQSSSSSLQSSASSHSYSSSSSQADDRVLYTGMGQPKVYGSSMSGMRSSGSLAGAGQETLYPGPPDHHQDHSMNVFNHSQSYEDRD